MKKNQNGVSMVSLVITIIVIIILAAVAFSGSQETIGRAGFSGFTTDIDSVRTAFLTENIPNLMGEQAAKNNAVNEAQAYNFLAKGATTLDDTKAQHAWLSKGQAKNIQATRIEKETAKAAIGIDLPVRTVNTRNATNVEMSYFVTNKGDIFVWPPFARSDDGLFYVNDTTPVTTPEKVLISGDDEADMYGADFKFVVNGVTITVDNSSTNADATGAVGPTAAALTSASTFVDVPGVYYKDERNAEQAEGIESKQIYQDSGDPITGFDVDETGR